MRFHDYVTMRTLLLRNPDAGVASRPERREAIRKMSSDEVIVDIVADIRRRMNATNMLEVRRFFDANPSACNMYEIAVRERSWFANERPFYNVWPVAHDLVGSVTLNVLWSEVQFPQQSMLFRFAKGHEPHGMACALVHDYSHMLRDEDRFAALKLNAKKSGFDGDSFPGGSMKATVQMQDRPYEMHNLRASNVRKSDGRDETVEETIQRLWKDDVTPQVEFVFRLAIFTSLLAKGQDLITPVVLAKDRDGYELAGDEQKRWIEDRAARVQGRGFDLGKRLQEERDSSPHWRNPHLCLFWTGPGRGQPLLKVRRGGVVIPKALAEVPTGFFGPETPEELAVAEATYVRVPVSARVRFEILRRDLYRCQLCGKSAGDGVRLHIDHKHAAAKGGTNTPENLWTLCEPCNLGKSDLSLDPDADKPGP